MGQRTKHIDVKWHHIRDMIKEGELVVVYIRSEDNPADIMTKNTKEALFIKHSLNMKKGVLLVGSLNREDVVSLVERELVRDVQQTDEGIFLCVLSPTSLEASDAIEKLSAFLSDDLRSLDGDHNNWVTVVRRRAKKSGLQSLVTGDPVTWTEENCQSLSK